MNPINAEKYLTNRVVNGGPNSKNDSTAKRQKGRNRPTPKMRSNVKAAHKNGPQNSRLERIKMN